MNRKKDNDLSNGLDPVFSFAPPETLSPFVAHGNKSLENILLPTASEVLPPVIEKHGDIHPSFEPHDLHAPNPIKAWSGSPLIHHTIETKKSDGLGRTSVIEPAPNPRIPIPPIEQEIIEPRKSILGFLSVQGASNKLDRKESPKEPPKPPRKSIFEKPLKFYNSEPVVALRVAFVLIVGLVDLFLLGITYTNLFDTCHKEYFDSKSLDVTTIQPLFTLLLALNVATELFRFYHLGKLMRRRGDTTVLSVAKVYNDRVNGVSGKLTQEAIVSLLKGLTQDLLQAYMTAYMVVFALGLPTSMLIFKICLSCVLAAYSNLTTFRRCVVLPLLESVESWAKYPKALTILSWILIFTVSAAAIVPVMYILLGGDLFQSHGYWITRTVVGVTSLSLNVQYMQCPNATWVTISSNTIVGSKYVLTPRSSSSISSEITIYKIPDLCGVNGGLTYTCAVPTVMNITGNANTISFSDLTSAASKSNPTVCKLIGAASTAPVYQFIAVTSVLNTQCEVTFS